MAEISGCSKTITQLTQITGCTDFDPSFLLLGVDALNGETKSITSTTLFGCMTSDVDFWALSGTNVYNTNSGNVGIGISSPIVPLEVVGNIRSCGGGNFMFGGTAGSLSDYVGQMTGSIGVGTHYRPRVDGTQAFKFLMADGASIVCDIDSTNRRLGINTIPSYPFEVNSLTNTNATGIGSFFNINGTSDNRSTSLLVGQSAAAGKSVAYGFVYHTATTNSYGVIVNYGDNELTQSLTIKKGGNVGIGTITPAAKLDVSGDVTSTGYISGVKCGAFAYLASAATTTVTSGSTFYPIQGVFVNSPAEQFSGTSTPALQYTGTKTQYFEIDWHSSVKSDHASCTVTFGIKINGILATPSLMSTFLKTQDELFNLSGTVIVELKYYDEVQLVVTCDSSGDVLTINNYVTSINEFFD